MEVDTGATVTFVPKNDGKEVLAAKPVRATDVKSRSYSGHENPVKGKVDVCVMYGDQEAYLPTIVTDNEGHLLLGCNWLSALKLNWNHVQGVSKRPINPVEQLITRYSSLFDDTLGTIKEATAHLKMKPIPTPRFFKPQPFPFALKDKIAGELYTLEKVGVLEKSNFRIGLLLLCLY